LFSDDRAIEVRYARAWASWENALASIDSDGITGESPADYARAFARLENHYFYNAGFLSADQQILHPDQMAKIADTPGVIVLGRYDMICPPISAHTLSQMWPKSRLTFIGRAGHALSEPGISTELVRTMDMIGAQRHSLGL
jgi:proline iminopeptidase